VKIIRDADVAYTHLETLIHDYEGPELYPAAEAGWTWMRSPSYVVDELKWFGFDMVSLACNHSLDYSYGGLFSTWKVLNEGGMPHAGTGRHLGEARQPAYVDTGKGRVALISIASSFTGWARAGQSRPDLQGRPGLNPLRFHYVVDPDTLEMIRGLAVKLGWWVRNIDKEWLFHPAGLHHTILRFVEGQESGITTAADEEDAEGNLRSIRDARRRADWVVVHLHTHEWDANQGLSAPARFAVEFTRACISEGADLFIGGGSHSYLRGVEIYRNKPIFYDPGDFMAMADTVTKLPSDFYLSPGLPEEARGSKEMPADAFEARKSLPRALNPPGGYHTAKVLGSIVAVCSFEAGGKLQSVTLHPVVMTGKPVSQSGRPMLANPEMSRKVI
jgi:poly-gamma-glutamate synthesis protein (capsule biosynthesis protein)